VLNALRAEFHFQDFAVTDSAAAAGYDIKHHSLERFLTETPADIVVNGIAGAAGLQASLIAVRTHRTLALANKESIVMAGHLLQQEAEKYHSLIIPVDSEHSAIYSLIRAHGREAIERLIITASGGPFRTWAKERIQEATLQDALKHPTWTMGAKITIDSATLANKGLEVIEACRLFDVSPEIVKVVVHPESIVHSLVQTKDGMLYAQLSDPDMKHPILSALTLPETAENYLEPFDLFDKTLSFFRPRTEDFPLLAYAYEAAERGASYTIAYNAADEVAALAFLDGKLSFTDIARVVRSVLDEDWTMLPESFEDVFKADAKARSLAKTLI